MKNIEFIGRRENISTYKYGPHYVHMSNKAELIERLGNRAPNEVFYVSETYSQITPESAEFGDFSETGWVDYGSFVSLREVLKLLRDGYKEIQVNGESIDAYDADYHTVDYSTGTEQQNCLHISASKKNIERLMRALKGGE